MQHHRMPAVFAVAWLVGCGGGGADAGPEDAIDTKVPVAQQQAVASQGTSDSTVLVREFFSYTGSGRDPFLSLVRPGGEVRPLLEDLRVSAIYYDAAFPARSVAVLRDTTEGKRYQVRVGEEVGRLQVAEIRQHEVILTTEEFGQPRQVVLSLRRRQEDIR